MCCLWLLSLPGPEERVGRPWRGQWNWHDLLTGTSHPRTSFGAQLQCITGPQSAPGPVVLEISYGGSQVPSPGISFTYFENPVLRAFEPRRSFVRCGLSPSWLVSSPPLPADLRNVAELGWAGQKKKSYGKPPLYPDGLPPQNPDGRVRAGPLPLPLTCSHYYSATSYLWCELVEPGSWLGISIA